MFEALQLALIRDILKIKIAAFDQAAVPNTIDLKPPILKRSAVSAI